LILLQGREVIVFERVGENSTYEEAAMRNLKCFDGNITIDSR
jgi:hypothetical protein